jgi:hypothetical protein
MQDRAPRLPLPDDRASERSARALLPVELDTIRGGIDSVPLPERPALRPASRAHPAFLRKP